MKKAIRCPVCKKIITYRLDNPNRPFCSERCRLIDLGKWLSEEHRIEDDEQAEFDAPDIGPTLH